MRAKFFAVVAIVVIVAAFASAPVTAQISDTLNTYKLVPKEVPGIKWSQKYVTMREFLNLPDSAKWRILYRQDAGLLREVDAIKRKSYELVEDQRVLDPPTPKGLVAVQDTVPTPPVAAGGLTVDDVVRILAAMPQPVVNINNNNLGNQVVGDSSHVSGDVTVGNSNATAINNAAQAVEKVDSVATDTLKRVSVESRAIFRPYMALSYVAGGSQDMWFQMPLPTNFIGWEIGVMPDYSRVLAPSFRVRADWATTDHKCPFVPTANNQHFLNPAVFGLMAKVGVGGKLLSRQSKYLSLHGEIGYHFLRNANSDTHGWTPTIGANIAYSWGRSLLNLNSSVGFSGLGNGTDQPNQQPDGTWRRNPNDGKFRLPVNIRVDFVSAIGLGVFAEGNIQPYGWELNPSREAGQMFPEVQTSQPFRLGVSFVF